MQTRQSRRGRWPAHANWIMNARLIVKQGSTMWQGVMKAWHTLQSGLEQQDPACWEEVLRQPLYGNRMLTNEVGQQWGTEPTTTMAWWPGRNIKSLKDMIRPDGYGWKAFEEQWSLPRTRVTPTLYERLRNSIPWDAIPTPPPSPGQWLAAKEEDGTIYRIFHITSVEPIQATLYHKDTSERLLYVEQHHQPDDSQLHEVRVIQCGGTTRTVLSFNPKEVPKTEHTLWLWGGDWIRNLEWDPKEWQWRRIGLLADTSILNYSTKRGYRVALRQNNHQMKVDAELEATGFNSKTRAKFFNRIWHPYLPRKVSAMQWLILTEGLPVGAWRERLKLPSECQLCPEHSRETLQHAFMECPEISRAWSLFRNTRSSAGLPEAFHSWKDISRGLMVDPPGPSMEEELRWDTAAAYKVTMDTPWDILRALLLWAIWCSRVDFAFRDEQFHLGLVIWNAWRNTIYCAMEAYKELFRYKRNEEKRHEAIECFQNIWTAGNIFGRLQDGTIKWNLTPNVHFLPRDLGAWLVRPIRINRLSESPDPEADFMAQSNLADHIDNFLQEIATHWRPHQDSNQPVPLTPTAETSSNPTQGPENANADNSWVQDTKSLSRETRDNSLVHQTDTLGETLSVPCSSPHHPTPNIYNVKSGDHMGSSERHPKSRNKRKCIRKKPVVVNKIEECDQLPGSEDVQRPKSRHKIRCRFGPLKRKGVLSSASSSLWNNRFSIR